MPIAGLSFGCPKCGYPMARDTGDGGVFWRCETCGGRAVTIPRLRRSVQHREVSRLWQLARASSTSTGRTCPSCARAFRRVVLDQATRAIELDVCTSCQFVWLDKNEYEQLPLLPVEHVKPMPPEAAEILARARVKSIAEHANSGERGRPPDTWWGWILGALGLPVEGDQYANPLWPWATWTTAALIVAVSVIAVVDLTDAIEMLGLIPSQLWRYGGLTVVTAFFIHAGVVHLLGNLYFLLVFGDNVESELGRRGYLLLLASATIAGGLLHAAFDPRPDIPVVGASGGISGLIVFYALAFPRARFTMLFWYVWWIRIPVRVYVGIWIALQALTIAQQLGGLSNVSGLGHGGGALVGLLWWLGHRRRARSARSSTLRSG